MSGIISEDAPGAICDVERGCGFRTKGALYAETGLGPHGLPLEDFFIDPPTPIDPTTHGISSQGMTFKQDGAGTWHLIDWIGEKYYETAPDFLQEVKALGLSRKMNPKLDLSRLTPASRIVLLHPKGYLANAQDYHFPPDGTHFSGCMCEKPEHAPDQLGGVTCCIGTLWDSVPDGVPEGSDPRLVRRTTGGGSYLARLDPEGVAPDWRPALIARFPIGRFAVVKDPDTGAHEEMIEKLKAAGHTGVVVDH